MELEAIIEKGETGEYSIYIPNAVHALNGYGTTEAKAKECLQDCIADIVAYCRDAGIEDGINGGKVTITYKYDLSGFFKSCDFFDVTAFAKEVGINPSLMRQYKAGIKKASVSQKAKIYSGIRSITKRLNAVKF